MGGASSGPERMLILSNFIGSVTNLR